MTNPTEKNSQRHRNESAGFDDAYSEYTDEFGMVAPIPADHGQRQMPDEDFSFGPDIGQRLPGFKLRASTGGELDLHTDRGVSKAAVVFLRSAVW